MLRLTRLKSIKSLLVKLLKNGLSLYLLEKHQLGMLKVLYVDDEPINLKIFELSFKNDFIVYRAESAINALEIFRNETIDVVVSDLKMPVMNGVEFIREVKKQKPAMKCILLTAYYDTNMFLDPEIQSIIYKSVVKPFKKNEMKEIIREAAV